jgi:hypothetical protein
VKVNTTVRRDHDTHIVRRKVGCSYWNTNRWSGPPEENMEGPAAHRCQIFRPGHMGKGGRPALMEGTSSYLFPGLLNPLTKSDKGETSALLCTIATFTTARCLVII